MGHFIDHLVIQIEVLTIYYYEIIHRKYKDESA